MTEAERAALDMICHGRVMIRRGVLDGDAPSPMTLAALSERRWIRRLAAGSDMDRLAITWRGRLALRGWS